MRQTSLYDMRLSEDRLPMLIRECVVTYPDRLHKNSPHLIAEWLDDVLDIRRRAQEIAVLLLFDAGFNLIGYSVLSSGSITTTVLSARETYQVALAAGATAIVVAHQHPSLDPTPSREDRTVMEQLKSAGEMIGIPLADFLIIGDTCYSARENGDL